MEEHSMEKKACGSQEDSEVRKGPWTMEEDLILINYIATHGEGVWNNLARSAGLKRSGKSCRLRWLNYLRPDIRRGNITPEEQLLIVDLQARWGNRWSKIARQLPGRTDNEIKNFWRTRIQKKAKHADPNYTYDYDQKCSTQEAGSSDNVYHKSSTTTFSTAEEGGSSAFADVEESNVVVDGLWGVDDLWSIPLFNND